MKEELNEQILARYFSGEANEDELAQVNHWLEAAEGNQKILDDYYKIWKASEQDTFKPNVDKAWEKVAARTVKRKRIAFIPWAAAVAGILLVGSWLYFEQNEAEMAYTPVKSEKYSTTKILADGSTVTLNSFSLLEYPEHFEGDERRVRLIGEAFFDIQRDESKPFIIEANGTEIKVLGTSFVIEARDENVKVSVSSGKVEFSSPANEKVLLTVNEEAQYLAESDTIKTARINDRNIFAFKTKVFDFDKTDLSDVVSTLNKGYQTQISLGEGDWSAYKLSTRFENENLADVLLIVAETFDLNLSRKDSAYVFTKKSNLQ